MQFPGKFREKRRAKFPVRFHRKFREKLSRKFQHKFRVTVRESSSAIPVTKRRCC